MPVLKDSMGAMAFRAWLTIASALALLSPAHAASRPNTLQGALQRAERPAREQGKQGVAVVVLQRDLASRDRETFLGHSLALRFAFRHDDLIELRPRQSGRCSARYPGGACTETARCAQNAFLDKRFPAGQIQRMEGAPAMVPVLLVLRRLDARPPGISCGLNGEQEILRFAEGLGHATSGNPFGSHGDAVLDD